MSEFWKIRDRATGHFWNGRHFTENGTTWTLRHNALVALLRMGLEAGPDGRDVELCGYTTTPVSVISGAQAKAEALSKRKENSERRAAADKRARIRDAERRLAEARK